MGFGGGVYERRGRGGPYGEIGMERSGIGAGFEIRHNLRLFRRGGGSDDFHGLVPVGRQNDVVVDIGRSISVE